MWFALLVVAVIGAAVYFKLHLDKKKTYWKKYGIRQIDTSPGFSFLDLILQRKCMFAADDYAYQRMGTDKFIGYMDVGKPMILVKDLELIKKILIKDFDYFVDRRQFFSSQDAMLQRMLPSLRGDEWKGVRTAVSPTFTTGKIRRMMDYFNSVGKEWTDELTSKAKASPDGSIKVDMMKTVNQYTIDVIASAVFGMNAGTIKNPNSPFATMAFRLADLNVKQAIKFSLIFALPKLYNLLKISLLDMEALGFFEGILDQGLKSRMKGEMKRNDFLQLLVEAKKGELKAEGSDELNAFEKEAQLGGGAQKQQYLTEDIMNAQSLVFFFAGFSTTSNFITMASYLLAAHQDVQDKLRSEVGKIVKPDGSLDYDEVGHLVYLDMVLSEVNRHYPAAGRLERLCVKDYKDPESGLFVPKGTMVGIPVNSMHHDELYYEQPEKFYPEHFTPDKKTERNPYVYLPFGMGPRNCIGMRFALIESKAAVAHLVHHFRIEPSAKTPLPVRGRPIGFQLAPPKDLELKLTPIQKH